MPLIRAQFLFLAWAVNVPLLAGSVVAQPLEPVLRAMPGFAVERLYAVPRDSQGSWVSLAADSRGYSTNQYNSVARGRVWSIEITKRL